MKGPTLCALVLAGAIVAGWFGCVAHLTVKEDRSCGLALAAVGEAGAVNRHDGLAHALDRLSARHGGAGLQATVVFPDDTVVGEASGYARLESECPSTHRHHLFVGSVTKLYTAALVMDQVEKGTIALNDSVDRWIDLSYGDRVTVRMLMNHTSGIPSYTEDAGFLLRYLGFPAKRWQPSELLRVIQARPLGFEPGSRHQYSNSNYILLGAILERATGKSYGALLREATDELGLGDTFYLDYPQDTAIANVYDESLLHLGTQNLTGFRRSLESGAYSAGGVLATSTDVALFVDALLSGRFLAASSLAQMRAFVDAPDEDVPLQEGYGLGLRALRLDGEAWVGHTGSIPGYSGIAAHHEGRAITVVILSTRSVIEQTELLADVAMALRFAHEPGSGVGRLRALRPPGVSASDGAGVIGMRLGHAACDAAERSTCGR